jgi:hypothetical protein
LQRSTHGGTRAAGRVHRVAGRAHRDAGRVDAGRVDETGYALDLVVIVVVVAVLVAIVVRRW